ncbi:MAG: helix-turn-helix domain-containing protein [Rhodospirillaceae bacterium]|jgi:cytoskeleton protein RodZ|nr:helix-turn-helix domain-containing protein [Rhodospirillaceae bacterium]MBT4464625.1 helix-turn-helix domain-containing protein [Rhodospirillaceae bacterium]MBT5013381.1 helix-turn-helix domain-containing protein [Rhodospirillaceae bacterium]MBT7357084.1 helix-turn-helix domain-containing protein [Rhodospirillaceae bacterium]
MMSQDTDNAAIADQDSDHGAGVGMLLRASRERLGEDLRSVASILHIRFIYLEAIEEGRFDDLPGTAYVIGFIRSYSEYLGLDSAEVVRRFKEESAAATENTELVFPVPIPESSIPGGAIVLVGFMVAAFAYGVWYMGTAKDGFFAQMVTPVPERLADKAPAPTPEPEQITVAKTVAKAEPVKVAEEAEPVVEKQVVMLSEAEQERADALLEAMAEEVVVAAPETPVEPETTVEQPVAQPAPQEVATVTNGTVNGSVNGTVSGSDNQVSRILVKARQNSWIQVRDDVAQQLVVTKVLRAGDSYQVPNQPGLKLLTGNAGALDIFVDGQVVPAIGESGSIRRGVALDPDRLVQGAAVD